LVSVFPAPQLEAPAGSRIRPVQWQCWWSRCFAPVAIHGLVQQAGIYVFVVGTDLLHYFPGVVLAEPEQGFVSGAGKTLHDFRVVFYVSAVCQVNCCREFSGFLSQRSYYFTRRSCF